MKSFSIDASTHHYNLLSYEVTKHLTEFSLFLLQNSIDITAYGGGIFINQS
jgi:hypothetical protein